MVTSAPINSFTPSAVMPRDVAAGSRSKHRRELFEGCFECFVVACVEEPIERAASGRQHSALASSELAELLNSLLELRTLDDSVDGADAKRLLGVEGHSAEDCLKRVTGK